jgi:glycine/D-amino acid oxidase-like deaminating enzyme
MSDGTVHIIGAGFSGLAAALFLSRAGYSVTIYDEAGIGGGASGISAGLLHPYAGVQAKLSWLGNEGMQEAKSLIEVAEEALGYPVASKKGVLRPILNEKQAAHFAHSAKTYSDIDWLEAEAVCELAPALKPRPAILIRSGMSIDVKSYLEGLWLACEKMGARFEQKRIENIEQLDGRVVVTAGHGTASLVSETGIHPVKGQLLKLAWPEHLPPLELPVAARAYLMMDKEQQTCWAGATFEHHFTDSSPDRDEAAAQLLPLIRDLIPDLADAEILDVQAGIRASSPNRKPILKQAGDRMWILTGMGSKGLLYHALFARKLQSHLQN